MTSPTPRFDASEFGLSPEDFVSEAAVCDVLEAAGGVVTGRIRLQKTIYLLAKMGFPTPFTFAYHHYGPFSADLANTIDFSVEFGMVEEEVGHRKSDGARFSKFRLKARPDSRQSEFFSRREVEDALKKFMAVTSTVLELAGTIYWLKHDERCADWRSEIIRRKGVKTREGRLEEAVGLLRSVGLS
jgi:uncharacterized protein YwgA